MYSKIVRNDIKHSKLISSVTIIFVAIATMLVSLAAIMVVNLVGSVDNLMLQAKTPHFLQMHSGEVDINALSNFAQAQPNVAEYQTLEFLNIDGEQIESGGKTLASSIQDNGLSVQSRQFDYLLNLDGDIVYPADGEIYVPITYWKEGVVEIGDAISICGHPFTVVGVLRDSQMNASMASSKRFLINENEFETLRQYGNIEYLIEFRLNDMGSLSAFENTYFSAGLPINGPAVTYPQFKLINALSDGMMIGLILLISLLMIAVAFLCIRFTLLAKIEDDYREIGVMKAIGLRTSDIKRICLAKYIVIAAIGSLLGYGLSFCFKSMLLENIRLYMGGSGNEAFSQILGFLGMLVVLFLIVVYVNAVLKQFRKISAASSLRFGVSQESPQGSKSLLLSGRSFPSTNVILGIKDVLSRKKVYTTMLIVLILGSFILIVPQNLHHTISSEHFTRYMGIGQSDMRIDIQQTNDISGKSTRIAQAMESDDEISQYVVLTTKNFKLQTDNGTDVQLKIELGDHEIFPVEYASGALPIKENEIALSSIQAEDLDKVVGDTISIETSKGAKTLIICGIYSDVTNGGKTAKAVFSDDDAEVMWRVINAKIINKSQTNEKIVEYAGLFEFAKVSDIVEYTKQIFGSSIQAIRMASYVAVAIALASNILIVLLFMKMLIAKDRYNIAVMKALGFTRKDIQMQYLARSLFVLAIAVGLGVLLANTLGESLAGLFISNLGIVSFRFIANPVISYLLSPLALMTVTLIAAIVGTTQARQIKITESIKE